MHMILDALLVGVFTFFRRVWGILTRPYETYRMLMQNGSVWELAPLVLGIGAYLAGSSLVKTAAFRPFVLTRHFIKTSGAVIVTFFVVSFLLWFIAKKVGGRGAYKPFAIGWAYTLIPTLLWFTLTSVLYLLFPPPRTTAWTGMSLSIVFLTLSAVLLFWKIILGYLTLRFSMRMDMKKILLTVCVVGPVIGAYSVGMYALGIFRIPFL